MAKPYVKLVIGLFLLGFLITCTKNKTTEPVAFKGNIVNFSKDSLYWNVAFSDTIRAAALGVPLSAQKGYSIHFIDSEHGMEIKDSVFSWTPKDTGHFFINGTVCGANGACDTLRDTLHIIYAPNIARAYKLSHDTLLQFFRFSDTLRPDSSSFARFGAAAYSYHCIDSLPNLTIKDSVLSWLPQDTGVFQIRIGRCFASGHCDTLRVSLTVISSVLPSLSFRFSKDTICLGGVFTDTLKAARFTNSKLIGRITSTRIMDAGKRALQLTDSMFLFIPQDSGRSPVAIVVGDSAGNFFSILDTFFVHQCSADFTMCPPYTHKNDAAMGKQSDLPEGFFVFSHGYNATNQKYGLYVSDIRKFASWCIPGTENEVPRSVKISDDGKWVLFVNGMNNAFVISIDGSRKYQVPLSGAQVNMADFYHNGPNGAEICYTTSDTIRQEIYAIQVKLDSVATFGVTRTLADLTGSFRIEPYYPISVVKDQILGAFSLLWQGSYSLRMGFLTIPDGGRGIALSKDIYKWANEKGRQVWGCNSTMSFDGALCLYIPGTAGTNNLSGPYAACIPQEHRGFVVTPFRRSSDPAISIDQHIDSLGLSINWCPSQYNFGTWDQMDFHAWDFGNNNDLAIGTQTGTQTPLKCVWMVDWKHNVWTQLTPSDSMIDAEWAAVYFTGTDTGNSLDPHYHVSRPNGGDQFTVGQQCSVTVTSQRDANAGIRIKIANGKYSFLLPGVTSSINPHTDSMFVFTIPATFTLDQGSGLIQQISSVSDSCTICVQDYNSSTGFKDCSDSFFSIKAAP